MAKKILKATKPDKKQQRIIDKFLEYYAEVPLIKYAAGYAGIDESTAHIWKNEFQEFQAKMEELKSEYLRNKLKKIEKKKADWIVERLLPYRNDFEPPRTTQVFSNENGESFKIQIVEDTTLQDDNKKSNK